MCGSIKFNGGIRAAPHGVVGLSDRVGQICLVGAFVGGGGGDDRGDRGGHGAQVGHRRKRRAPRWVESEKAARASAAAIIRSLIRVARDIATP